MKRTTLWIVLLGLTLAGTAKAVPHTVSPGGERELLPATGGCPTFSWAGPVAATSYDLAIFELPAEAQPSSPALAEMLERAPLSLGVRLPGGASSWTPPADRCLEAGGRYAWFLRADDSEDWSRGRFFEVASESELERAVAKVLERYLAERSITITEAVALAGGGAAVATPAAREAATEATTADGKAPPATLDGDAAIYAYGGDTDITFGVKGRTDSTTAGSAGLLGHAPGGSSVIYGVRGVSESTEGRGVAGEATADSGVNYGVYGATSSDEGTAVFGVAIKETGGTVGVGGASHSPDGFGGQFVSEAAGGAALFAKAKNKAGPDLLLGSNEATDDPGLVASDNDLKLEAGAGKLVKLGSDDATADDAGNLAAKTVSGKADEVMDFGGSFEHEATNGTALFAGAKDESGADLLLKSDGVNDPGILESENDLELKVGPGKMLLLGSDDASVDDAGNLTANTLSGDGSALTGVTPDDLNCAFPGCVDSSEIIDGTIELTDIGNNGCNTNQVLKSTGAGWECSNVVGGLVPDVWVNVTGDTMTGGLILDPGATMDALFVRSGSVGIGVDPTQPGPPLRIVTSDGDVSLNVDKWIEAVKFKSTAPSGVDGLECTDCVQTGDIATDGVETGDIKDDDVTSTDIKDATILLADLNENGCTDNQVMFWNDTTNLWECGAAPLGEGTILLENLAQNGCTNDQVIIWNDAASEWICGSPPSELTADSVTTNEIDDGTIQLEDIGQNGCSDGQVAAWNASMSEWECKSNVPVDSVGTMEILNNAVTTDKILNGAVTTDKILNDAVTTDKILDDAVATDKILDDAVTTDKILNDAVTTDKINDGAVTAAKLDSIRVVAVECEGECTDDTNTTLGDICDEAGTGLRAVFVDCGRVQDHNPGSGCGDDNRCSSFATVADTDGLSTYCKDDAGGWDAQVYCMSE